jgi:hypothetical protein
MRKTREPEAQIGAISGRRKVDQAINEWRQWATFTEDI